MASSTRDPFSPSVPGNVAGSASREGLAGTRAYSQVGATVGRDSGTNGLGRSVVGTQGPGGGPDWLPLSDMLDKPVTPNAGDKLVAENTATASEEIQASRDEMGGIPEIGEVQVRWEIGTAISPEGQRSLSAAGQAINKVTIAKDQGMGQGAMPARLADAKDALPSQRTQISNKRAGKEDARTGKADRGDKFKKAFDE